MALVLSILPRIHITDVLSKLSKETLRIAKEMSLAHNIFVRTLNAIYLQAPNVSSPTDITDLLTYCQSWYEALHHHHAAEEEYFFPAIEAYTGQKGIMETNLEQHAAFGVGVKLFKDYVYGIKAEEFDAAKLKGLIDAFGDTLQTHLKDEIPSLLDLDRYGGDRLAKAWVDLDKHVMESGMDKVCSSPVAL